MEKKIKLSLALLSLFTLTLSGCSFDHNETKPVEPGGNSGDDPQVDPPDNPPEPPEEEKFKGYAPAGYELKWGDEFDASVLSDNWEPMIGDGSNYGIYRWGNNEEQYYKAENAYVEDDALHILALREETTYQRDENTTLTYHFSSARLRTTKKVFTTYGYIESRILLPAGTGLWPAFWMLPESRYEGRGWPVSGEIDIMEARGRIPTSIGATIHSGNASGQQAYTSKDYNFTDGEDITSYHCYGVEWTEAAFYFYVDGNLFHTVTNTTYQRNNPLYTDKSSSAPFDQPFHLLLNLAIGGNFDGGKSVSSDFKEAEMLVDYVRIFNKVNNEE